MSRILTLIWRNSYSVRFVNERKDRLSTQLLGISCLKIVIVRA